MTPPTSFWAPLTLALCFAASWPARGADSVIPISAIRSLPRAELSAGQPVRARGIVTYCNTNGDFALQDTSGGIWVNVFLARVKKFWSGSDAELGRLKEGAEVEVEAVTIPGGYSPSLLPSSLRVLAGKPLPPARRLDRSSFFSGAEAGQRIEVTGTLLGFEPMTAGWRLRLQANPDVIHVMVLAKALADPRPLLDAELRVRGVAASGFNNRGEQLYPRVVVSVPGDLEVITRNSLSPFSLPLVPLDQIDTFHSHAQPAHRQRIEGTVTFDYPGHFFYIQDGNRAVRVESRSMLPLQAGDRVQAVGYVDMSRYIAMLQGAEVRRIGSGRVPEPLAISPEEILRINTSAKVIGQPPTDFDGHAIRFRAQLLAVQAATGSGQPSRKLVIKQNGLILSAELYAGRTEALDGMKAGSELEITGLAELEYAPVEHSDPLLSPNGLAVILRDPADVVVLRAPSWWTSGRLLGLLAAIVVILAGTLFWIGQLRRQVRRKTQEIAAEMRARRDAAIEFKAALRERNRLAANLHDTILQTIGGIGFQMEACEAEAAALAPGDGQNTHLAIARRMLDHAAEELRGSVWALRSLPQQGLTLPEALKSMAERAVSGQTARVVVRTIGELPPISDFIAGNLLLAAQEAVHNSLKHGNPKLIVLEVGVAPKADGVEIRISDDGIGFIPGRQVGAAQGHFGLAGMAERIEGLAGTLRVESEPGQGTTICLQVPLRTYDEELA